MGAPSKQTQGVVLKLLAAITVASVALGGAATTANAVGLIAKPKDHTIQAIYNAQVKNYHYAKYLCNNGRNHPKLWGCKAVKWIGREMRETYSVLHPVIVITHTGGYQGVSAIRYAQASCESGGDPHNTHNPKYRGKWQFDQGTWNAYAPAGYKGIDPAYAPESIQDQAAMAVPYDAWPNC